VLKTLNFLGQNAGSATSALRFQAAGPKVLDRSNKCNLFKLHWSECGNGATAGANDSKFHGFCKLVKEATNLFIKFLWSECWLSAINANQSNFFGRNNAGFEATNANQSTFIGSVLVRCRIV
jgi:hypothetical protein